jgi:hypothetical protein
MKYVSSSLLVISVFLPMKVFANLPEFSDYLDAKITLVEAAIEDRSNTTPPDPLDWILEDMNIDITPSVTLGLNKVLALTITPEIDIVLVPSETAKGLR